MGRSSKPRHAHRPRLIRIPMTAGLHDQIGMALHTALATLAVAPTRDQFDSVGQIFNMIGVAIEDDARFEVEFQIIESGARAMNQIADCYDRTGVLRLTDLELAPVRNAVVTCDQITSRLDVTKLHLANMKLASMRNAA